ncbi:hypothetical protein V6N11_066987 [Hibiscus sabdariffa]|uniref:Sugar phosphate transporter domain-containing protein n=1 Tax=Hibiscus sabdariffa TaxID=183260 RepID=A0ABR2SQ75_9ROSI
MSTMATNSFKNPILPISDPPVDKEEEKERLLKRGDDRLFKGSAMTKRGAYAAVYYMTCAVLLILFNKAALSSYGFPCANVITLFQMISSCTFLYALRRWKMISFANSDSLTISDGSSSLVPIKTLIHTLPLAGTYLLYMLVTVESVRGVNVPMYTTLRRTTVVFTMIVEFLLAGQKYSSSIVGSVGLIVLGAFVAGARDLSFDFYGYGFVFLANITTAIYLATIARVGKSSGLNSFGLMWCNGCIDSFVYTSFLLELHYILEHNSQFSSHTNHLWQSEGSFYRWTWLDAFRWASLRYSECYRAIAGICWFWFVCLLQACRKITDFGLTNKQYLIGAS